MSTKRFPIVCISELNSNSLFYKLLEQKAMRVIQPTSADELNIIKKQRASMQST